MMAGMASPIARRIRAGMTNAERHLWSRLKNKQLDGVRFRRQAPIASYVVDFYCHAARLVVELDGGQHTDQADRDLARTQDLERHGFRVIRFWNNEVFDNIESVLERIRGELIKP
jgi:very-short-patch-repair endonuclease